jgi:hypothetical protein
MFHKCMAHGKQMPLTNNAVLRVYMDFTAR